MKMGVGLPRVALLYPASDVWSKLLVTWIETYASVSYFIYDNPSQVR